MKNQQISLDFNQSLVNQMERLEDKFVREVCDVNKTSADVIQVYDKYAEVYDKVNNFLTSSPISKILILV